MHIAIVTAAFSAEEELARFTATRTDTTGALASFVGYCRGEAGAVERLELQHYPGFTETEITRLAENVAQRHALIDLVVIHRVGAIAANEPIVLVAALSAHRAGAFAAVGEMMDYLKTDAPIWKRQVGPDGARWIEPTAEDMKRREKFEP